MIPVQQTRTGSLEGNCTEARVASLLEVSLDDLPDLAAADAMGLDRWKVLGEYVQAKGFDLFWFDLEKTELGDFFPDQLIPDLPWSGYHLMAGPNPDGVPHMVVGADGRMVWDPNPKKGGIQWVDGFGLLLRTGETPQKWAEHFRNSYLYARVQWSANDRTC